MQRSLGRWRAVSGALERGLLVSRPRFAWIVFGTIVTAAWWLAALDVARQLRPDAAAYWAADLDSLYAGARLGQRGAYLYSPAFAQLTAPLRLLPFETYVVVWSAALLAAVVWLARLWTPLVVLLPPVAAELMLGNIHAFLAVAIALGFRYPAVWALVLHTKVTPGIGLIWFAARREWRALGIALLSTVVVAAVSFVLAPELWSQWAQVLLDNATRPAPTDMPLTAGQPIPLALRLPLAIALVTWGARTDRPWTVAVAAYLALPFLWTTGQLLLLALLRLPRVPWRVAWAGRGSGEGQEDRSGRHDEPGERRQREERLGQPAEER